MKKHTQILAWTLIGLTMAAQTIAFANGDANIMPINTSNTSDEYIPPVYNNNVTYEFDKNLIKAEKPALYKVSCDNATLFKRFGIDNGKNFTALEYKEGDYIYRGDFRGCSFSAWREEDTSMIDWKKAQITEKEALAKAAEFLAANKIAELTFKLGNPIVTSKMKDFPIMYSEASSSVKAEPVKDPQIQEEKIKDDGKYQSITIVYPILVGGKVLRTTWDDPVGVSLSVDGRGIVTSMTATTKFTLKKRTSDISTDAELVSFIKKGGNNMYYPANGGTATVKLDSIERGLVMFTYYTKGTSDQYLSTGFRLESNDTKNDYGYGMQKKYSQVVSDFIIGNSNMNLR